jgi:hypothetical protein
MDRNRIVLRSLPLAAVVAILSCGGDGKTVVTPSQPQGLVSIAGSVVSNQRRLPVAGATLTMGTTSATTDSRGNFSVNVPPSDSTLLRLSATGYVPREAYARADSSRTAVAVDMIAEEPPFSLPFYREFARNAAEGSSLQPTRPWTVAPSFYIKTTDDQGQDMPEASIEILKAIFVNSVPDLTAGRFSVATIETGPDERPARDGWVNVIFQRVLPSPTAVGQATVGGNQGTMWIKSTGQTVCGPPGPVAAHEILHTMGYWHTATVPWSVSFTPGNWCDGTGRPSITLYHAAIMYSRPAGNVDPDADPQTRLLARQPGPVVSCFRQ